MKVDDILRRFLCFFAFQSQMKLFTKLYSPIIVEQLWRKGCDDATGGVGPESQVPPASFPHRVAITRFQIICQKFHNS